MPGAQDAMDRLNKLPPPLKSVVSTVGALTAGALTGKIQSKDLASYGFLDPFRGNKPGEMSANIFWRILK